MEKKEVRIPQQKRSIEKKQKILDAATKIFMEKGYFGINTADIAKAAGISTGSVYAYFEDKKDILMAKLNQFGQALTQEISEKTGELSNDDDISGILRNVIKIFAVSHNWTKPFRDEITSLQYIDDDVKNYFDHIQKAIIKAAVNQLASAGYAFPHEREQTFLLYQMVMGIEDQLAFNLNSDIDQDILINECANAIVPMLVKKKTPQT